jgi:hypothetical protein
MYLTTILHFAGGIKLIDFSNYLFIEWKNVARLDVR